MNSWIILLLLLGCGGNCTDTIGSNCDRGCRVKCNIQREKCTDKCGERESRSCTCEEVNRTCINNGVDRGQDCDRECDRDRSGRPCDNECDRPRECDKEMGTPGCGSREWQRVNETHNGCNCGCK